MPDTLGQKVRRARFSKGWSLQKLHEESGVAIGAIRGVENNTTKPYGQTLFRLAEALGLDPDELLDAMEGVA